MSTDCTCTFAISQICRNIRLSFYPFCSHYKFQFCFQVSTWFANARRRLKKENKMTWEPKNKLDDEDVDVSDDDDKDKDDDKHGE